MEIAPLALTPVQNSAPLEALAPLAPLQAGASGDSAQAAQRTAGFQQLLSGAIGQVNQYSEQADSMIKKLVTGQNVELHQVMIAMQKESISTQLLLQVRNKIVDAYQQVMNMQI